MSKEIPPAGRGTEPHSGLVVEGGFKLGDVDPSVERQQCFLVSDKAVAVAEGVLRAARALLGTLPAEAGGPDQGRVVTSTRTDPRPAAPTADARPSVSNAAS